MSQRDTVIHLVAGGVAGTVAAVVTCPLEVVKTRLQSSHGGFYTPPTQPPSSPPLKKEPAPGHVACKSFPNQRKRLCLSEPKRYSLVTLSHSAVAAAPVNVKHQPSSATPGIMQCLRMIYEHEGPRALFKGLVPNIIGVAPSRAIYFCTYAQTKNFLNGMLPPDTPVVHMGSASAAGFVSCTATNPIWFVKTRLQLTHDTSGSALECIRNVYQQSGIRGFYKGIVASYVGISETVVHFVIYEAIKTWLITHRATIPSPQDTSKSSRDFIEFMGAGAFSKTIASCIAYPHEVVRTRLREEGNKYKGFWESVNTIVSEEGSRGLYRGLATQLVRQIPNTAIMMATYEAVVYLLSSQYESMPPPTSNTNTMHTTTEFYTEAKTKRELA